MNRILVLGTLLLSTLLVDISVTNAQAIDRASSPVTTRAEPPPPLPASTSRLPFLPNDDGSTTSPSPVAGSTSPSSSSSERDAWCSQLASQWNALGSNIQESVRNLVQSSIDNDPSFQSFLDFAITLYQTSKNSNDPQLREKFEAFHKTLAKGFRKRYNPGSCNINFGVDFSRFKLPHLDFDWPWKQKNLEFDWPWKQNKDKNDVVDSTKSPKKEWCEDLSATWNGLGSQVQSTLRTFVQSLIKNGPSFEAFKNFANSLYEQSKQCDKLKHKLKKFFRALHEGRWKHFDARTCNIDFGIDLSNVTLPHFDRFNFSGLSHKMLGDSAKCNRTVWCSHLSSAWTGLGSQIQDILRTFAQALTNKDGPCFGSLKYFATSLYEQSKVIGEEQLRTHLKTFFKAIGKGFWKRYDANSCNINFGFDFSRLKLPKFGPPKDFDLAEFHPWWRKGKGHDNDDNDDNDDDDRKFGFSPCVKNRMYAIIKLLAKAKHLGLFSDCCGSSGKQDKSAVQNFHNLGSSDYYDSFGKIFDSFPGFGSFHLKKDEDGDDTDDNDDSFPSFPNFKQIHNFFASAKAGSSSSVSSSSSSSSSSVSSSSQAANPSSSANANQRASNPFAHFLGADSGSSSSSGSAYPFGNNPFAPFGSKPFGSFGSQLSSMDLDDIKFNDVVQLFRNSRRGSTTNRASTASTTTPASRDAGSSRRNFGY